MECNFVVGQKVVAVGRKAPAKPTRRSVPRPEGNALGASYPEIGKIYTIRQINAWDDGVVVLLEEVCNRRFIGLKGSKIEPGFPAECFRPVIDRKTDISQFKAMLNPSKVRETANV